MQYLIAHMLSGEAANYHGELSDRVARERKLTPVRTRIEPHLTLKAPFDAEDVSRIENILEEFSHKELPQPYTLVGFESFDGKVLYMHVDAPKQTHMLVRRLQDQLRNVPWLTFKKTEFPVTLHATVVYPKSREQCKEILKDLQKEKFRFDCQLYSIALLQKSIDKWELIKEYQLQIF